MYQTVLSEDLLKAYLAAAKKSGTEKVILSIANHSSTFFFAGSAIKNCVFPSLSGLISDSSTHLSTFKVYLWDTTSGENFLSENLKAILSKQTKRISTFDRQSHYIQYDPQGGILSYVNTTEREAFYFISNIENIPDYEIASPLLMIMNWFCRCNGLLLVHAAGIAYQNTGVLIVGRGGSGKSTTALLSFLNGFDLVGDDYVALSKEQGRWIAHQVYCGSKLMPASLKKLPELLSHIANTTNQTQEKRIIMLNAFKRGLVRSFPIDLILHPKLAFASDSFFETLSMITLMTAFAGSTMLQIPGNDAALLQELGKLCRELPAYFMHLSEDFSEISEKLKIFLASFSKQEVLT